MKQNKQTKAADLQAYEQVARMVMFSVPENIISGQPGEKEIKIARKNHLGLEFISHYPEAATFQTQEREKYNAFQLALQETSALFEMHGIPHIYIKFRKHYLYYDSNVDVIVRKDQWAHTISILKENGYSGHVMFKEPDKIMFSKPGIPVSIHLHPGVTWNGVPYFSSDNLWRNSDPSSNFTAREMTFEYDFLINIAHNLFENYDISLGDTLYFKRMLQLHSYDAERLEHVAAENGWLYGFQQVFGLVTELVETWEAAEQSSHIPEKLLIYPYRISKAVLVYAYSQRIAWNIAESRFGPALREIYAYPSFYALKRRHDLPFLR